MTKAHDSKSSSPDKDNWWRFGSPLDSDLSDEEEEEVEFDPDVDECQFDSMEDNDTI